MKQKRISIRVPQASVESKSMQYFTKKFSIISAMVLLVLVAMTLRFHNDDQVVKIDNPHRALLNDSLVGKQSIVAFGARQTTISTGQNFKSERVRKQKAQAVVSCVPKDSLTVAKGDPVVSSVAVSVRMDSSTQAIENVTEQAQPVNQNLAVFSAAIIKKSAPIRIAEFNVEQERIYNDVLNLIKRKISLAQQVEPPIAMPLLKETLLAANFSPAESVLGVQAAKSTGSAKRGLGFAVGWIRPVSKIGVISPLLGELSYNYRATGRLQIQIAANIASFKLSTGNTGSLVSGDLVSQYAFRVTSRVQPTLSLGLGLAHAGGLEIKKSPYIGTMLAGCGTKYRLSEKLNIDAQLQYKQLLTSLYTDNSLQRDGFMTFKVGLSFFFNETRASRIHQEENLMVEKI
jgi:hypothetical protein